MLDQLLLGGKIVASGDKSLAEKLEREGYAAFETKASNRPEAQAP